jgi:exonuclease SbcD
VQWRELTGARRFIDRRVILESDQDMMGTILDALPIARELEGAIIRLVVEYPREYDALIDEAELRKQTGKAFEFQLVRRPQNDLRIRLPADQTISSLSPLELLDQYWKASHVDAAQAEELKSLAREIISSDPGSGH